MPVYEYVCPDCETRFEKRRNISDSDADIKCPECERPDPERQFSVFCPASTTAGGSSSEMSCPAAAGGG